MKSLRGGVVLFFLCVLSVSLSAQTPSGEISGVASDATGSVVAGVRIALINLATNAVREAQTNDAGLYAFPALPPGIYTLRAEKAGFRTIERKNLELLVGSANRIDLALEVGEVSSIVEVEGGAPLLQRENASIGTVIENRSVVELPLNGRNYLQLTSLIPGATTNGPSSTQGKQRMGGQRNTFALNVAGQRIHYNHYSLDGVENTDLNFNSYMLLPSIDAIQEFKVESGLFEAEYGRAIAQINVSTKSGTNRLHGSAFEFLRNSALDAKNFFDKPAPAPIPPFKRNQYGLTVGGPVMLPKLYQGRDRLFFLFNWEGLRERKALTQLINVPLTAERNGNFSQSGVTIYDPDTRVFDADGKVIRAPTPFPDNRIPDNRINPVSRKLLAFFPFAQQQVRLGNYLNDESRRVDADQYTYRLDFNESQKSSWFFRHSISHELGYDPYPFPDQGINTATTVGQGVLANTRIFGANKVNDARLGLSRLQNGHLSPRAGVQNVVQELGINLPTDNPLYWGVPNLTIAGLNNFGEESDAPFINYDTTIQFVDNFSWTAGTHSAKFGGEVRRVRYNQIGGVVTRGRFTFDGRYTQNPLVVPVPGEDPQETLRRRGGSAVADFLLGHFNNSEAQIGAPIANFRSNYFALYVQDNWKLTPKLTLNYGLRWENDQPFRDKFDSIVNIDFRWDNSMEPVYVRAGQGDPYEGDPAFRLNPTVQYVRDGRFGSRAYRNDLNDFAPRLGLAYQLDSKTVLRTGAGIYYVRDIGNATFDIVRNAPFTIRRNEPAESFRPNLSYDRPFARTGAPTFILINQFDEPSSYVAQWSFGLQRQLTQNLSLEATYFGSAGIHLRRLQSYNNPEPSAQSDPNNARPFPKFGSFQVMNAPSHSSYHALYLKAQQRLAAGLTFLGSFSWSKSIDNGSGIRTTDGDSLTPANNYDLARERGLSTFDFRRRLTASWLWELPVGKGRRFLGKGGRAADLVFGGWQLGGILTLQDGFPFTVYCGPGNIQNGGGSCYPDSTGADPNLPRGEQTRTRFFNTDAYLDRSPGGPEFRYGNTARNSVIGPGIISLDASLNKKFRLTEAKYLEFRAEAFNLPNHPIWNPPGNTLRTPTYGVITGTRLDSRQLQFALKLVF
ncbi:MAG TPA: TonB-dependent receptor [Blastocatellia bacterium]|nr:TonB-dependent receptor [Blastocatellia bacterium]